MSVVHLPEGNDWHTLDFNNRVCQSFNPLIPFTLSWVDLQLKGIDPLSLPQAYLYLADVSSHPTGDFLAASVGVIAKPKDLGIENRWRLKMSPFYLVADQNYCLEVRGRSLLPPVTYDIRFQKDTGTYTRGFMSTSIDAGANWTSHVDDDLLFAVWGTPPVPPPPPDPPIVNWCVLDIEQILTLTGYKIVVTTNTPCHLYMYWTPTEPEKHPQTKIERGLAVPAATKYCFVVFTQNEQEEAGDTIYHTFIKEPWPECETRWFCFRAKVDGEWSASTSPIFQKHRIAPAWGPPQTVVYDPLVHDGYLATWRGSPFMSYAANWLADDGTVATTENTLSLYNIQKDPTNYVFRGVLFFDTAALPANCLIDSARVRIYPSSIVNPRHASICLTPATDLHTPLITSDYSALRNTPTIIASYPMDDMTVGITFWMNLSAVGLAAITKAGTTLLGIRIDFEIEADGCTDNEIFMCRCFENPPQGSNPKLEVTYRLPA